MLAEFVTSLHQVATLEDGDLSVHDLFDHLRRERLASVHVRTPLTF
jgi:hypothetical protein